MAQHYGRRAQIIVNSLILCSVATTLGAEAAIVFGAPWALRAGAATVNLVLDLVFFLEFAALAGSALAEGRLKAYLGPEGGWVDLCAAVLPLTFTSGPYLFGGSAALVSTTAVSALGSFRLLRGLGLLRILRLLRLFSEAAPDQASGSLNHKGLLRAATYSLIAVLGVLIVAEGASLAGLWPDAHGALAVKRGATLASLEAHRGADWAESIAMADADLLLVRQDGRVLYTRYSAEEYHRRFGPDEIGYLKGEAGLDAFFSLRAELRAEAASTFASGLCALAILLALAKACSGSQASSPAPGGQKKPEPVADPEDEADFL